MELTCAVWRPGWDPHGYYLTEEATAEAAADFKKSLPKSVTIEFNPVHVMAQIIDIWYDEDEQTVFLKIDLPAEEANKWRAFPVTDSIRPLMAFRKKDTELRNQDVYVNHAQFEDFSMAVISAPAPLPAPPPPIRSDSWMD